MVLLILKKITSGKKVHGYFNIPHQKMFRWSFFNSFKPWSTFWPQTWLIETFKLKICFWNRKFYIVMSITTFTNSPVIANDVSSGAVYTKLTCSICFWYYFPYLNQFNWSLIDSESLNDFFKWYWYFNKLVYCRIFSITHYMYIFHKFSLSLSTVIASNPLRLSQARSPVINSTALHIRR